VNSPRKVAFSVLNTGNSLNFFVDFCPELQRIHTVALLHEDVIYINQP
jgi:hypothetical protein